MSKPCEICGHDLDGLEVDHTPCCRRLAERLARKLGKIAPPMIMTPDAERFPRVAKWIKDRGLVEPHGNMLVGEFHRAHADILMDICEEMLRERADE